MAPNIMSSSIAIGRPRSFTFRKSIGTLLILDVTRSHGWAISNHVGRDMTKATTQVQRNRLRHGITIRLLKRAPKHLIKIGVRGKVHGLTLFRSTENVTARPESYSAI